MQRGILTKHRKQTKKVVLRHPQRILPRPKRLLPRERRLFARPHSCQVCDGSSSQCIGKDIIQRNLNTALCNHTKGVVDDSVYESSILAVGLSSPSSSPSSRSSPSSKPEEEPESAISVSSATPDRAGDGAALASLESGCSLS
jgi:hypothetical protein